jgi:hypothetical protein
MEVRPPLTKDQVLLELGRSAHEHDKQIRDIKDRKLLDLIALAEAEGEKAYHVGGTGAFIDLGGYVSLAFWATDDRGEHLRHLDALFSVRNNPRELERYGSFEEYLRRRSRIERSEGQQIWVAERLTARSKRQSLTALEHGNYQVGIIGFDIISEEGFVNNYAYKDAVNARFAQDPEKLDQVAEFIANLTQNGRRAMINSLPMEATRVALKTPTSLALPEIRVIEEVAPPTSVTGKFRLPFLGRGAAN